MLARRSCHDTSSDYRPLLSSRKHTKRWSNPSRWLEAPVEPGLAQFAPSKIIMGRPVLISLTRPISLSRTVTSLLICVSAGTAPGVNNSGRTEMPHVTFVLLPVAARHAYRPIKGNSIVNTSNISHRITLAFALPFAGGLSRIFRAPSVRKTRQ